MVIKKYKKIINEKNKKEISLKNENSLLKQ